MADCANFVPSGTAAPNPGERGAAEWLAANDKYVGARLIAQLIDDPDRHYRVEHLADRYWKNTVPRRQKQYPTTQSWGEPIPMTDPKTLAECKKEAKRFIKQIEGARALGDEAGAAELERQYQSLIRYIKECSWPSGRIKNFPDRTAKEYQRMYQAVQRVLRKARRESPEVYHYIKNHLRMGYTFAWISQGLKRGSGGQGQ